MDSVAIYLSSDSSDCDDNPSLRVRYKTLRDQSNRFEIHDTMFVKLFRLSKDAVKYLMDEIDVHLPTRSRKAFPNILKLAATLRFMAQGNYQHSVGQDFLIGLSQPCISTALSKVLSVMQDKVCSKWISYKQTSREKQKTANYFYNQTGFPRVIGCMDGTHINIVRPIVNEHLHFKRPYIPIFLLLLGNSRYPLESFLLTPYRVATEGSGEARYNTIHSKTRSIIERGIGILKARFTCLLTARELHYALKKAAQIVNVCVTLYNICLHFKVPFDNRQEIINEEELQDDIDGPIVGSSTVRQIRNNILNSIT